MQKNKSYLTVTVFILLTAINFNLSFATESQDAKLELFEKAVLEHLYKGYTFYSTFFEFGVQEQLSTDTPYAIAVANALKKFIPDSNANFQDRIDAYKTFTISAKLLTAPVIKKTISELVEQQSDDWVAKEAALRIAIEMKTFGINAFDDYVGTLEKSLDHAEKSNNMGFVIYLGFILPEAYPHDGKNSGFTEQEREKIKQVLLKRDLKDYAEMTLLHFVDTDPVLRKKLASRLMLRIALDAHYFDKKQFHYFLSDQNSKKSGHQLLNENEIPNILAAISKYLSDAKNVDAFIHAVKEGVYSGQSSFFELSDILAVQKAHKKLREALNPTITKILSSPELQSTHETEVAQVIAKTIDPKNCEKYLKMINGTQ